MITSPQSSPIYSKSPCDSLKPKHIPSRLLRVDSKRMFLQSVAATKAHSNEGYTRLSNPCHEKKTGPRKQWQKSLRKKVRGMKLTRSRKLSWKAISLIMVPRKIRSMYREILNALSLEGGWINAPFITSWGLPALSHSSVKCQKTAVMSCHDSILFAWCLSLCRLTCIWDFTKAMYSISQYNQPLSLDELIASW